MRVAKLEIVYSPEFLERILSIFGEPERVEVSVFQDEVRSEKNAGFVFYPQYTRFVHYKDPKKPIDTKGIIEIYSEQLSSDASSKTVEKLVWSDFSGQSLFSAEFLPTSLSLQVQHCKDGLEIISKLGCAIEELCAGKKRPALSVSIIFP